MKGFFDLTVGGKQEKEAYTKMAEEMDLKPEEILFFTGVPAGKQQTSLRNDATSTCLISHHL